MSKDPLDSVFGFDVDSEDFDSIEIPDDPQLDHIIQFSLKEYKGIKEIIDLIEPKNRIKYFEMMERFLANAKDAMYKKDMIKVAQEKLKKMGQPKGSSQPPKEEAGVDRNSLYEKRKQLKAVK
jgi:hypothetical protein